MDYVTEKCELKKAHAKVKYDKIDTFVTKHVTLAKRKYYSKYFKQHSSDSRKQWQMINKLLNRAKVKKHTITLKNSDGEPIKGTPQRAQC